MAEKNIVIIDYGSGNIASAAKALAHVIAAESTGHKVVVSADPQDLRLAERIVLPGQGAFGDCIHNLKAIPGMVAALEEAVLENARPFLGICVGMQLLATTGLEHGTHAGLGWIPGQVVPLKPQDPTLKIPHMGWNEVAALTPHFVLRSVESSGAKPPHYYFVHSFMVECEDKEHILGQADYGGIFPAIIGRDNIIGVQFHPEKSQDAGLNLLQNFIHWRP